MCLVELCGNVPLLSGESVAIKITVTTKHCHRTLIQVMPLWKVLRAARPACLQIIGCILVLQPSSAESSALGEHTSRRERCGRCGSSIPALLCFPQPWWFIPHGAEPQLLSCGMCQMCFIGLTPTFLNCHAENSCRN